MSKPKTESPEALASEAPAGVANAAETLRPRADALWRWAVETCHQHDRYARMIARTEDNVELRGAQELVRTCDRALCDVVGAWEKAAAKFRPDGDDAWWHRANGLWHACREYIRRHDGCEKSSRRVEGQSLGDLQMSYELEASALLALRHAADAYRKCCPEVG